jgi:hypothetical protein
MAVVKAATKKLKGLLDDSMTADAGVLGTDSKKIRAYHGSPYTFDRFDSSRIGRGEGVQAYGHGLYFAQNPEVARGYRDNVRNADNIDDVNNEINAVYDEMKQYEGVGYREYTDPRGYELADKYDQLLELRQSYVDNVSDIKIGNQDIDAMYERLTTEPATYKDYIKAGILEQIMIDGDVEGVLSRGEDFFGKSAFDWFKKDIEPNFKRTGSMYEVNLNVDPEGLLDWDKPLSQQSESVRNALSKYSQQGSSFYNLLGSDKAGQLYERMSRDLGSSDAASRALREQGIPGIRYLDAISRGAGKGSSNYVLFDPSNIEILKKYGLAGAAPIIGATGLLGLGSDQAYAGSVLPPNTPNVGQRIEAPVNPKTEMAAGLLGGLNRRLENRGLGLLAAEGLENYLRKAAYGDEVTYLDRLFAALDVAP